VLAYGAPSSIGRRAPIARPASGTGISSAETKMVSTASILLFGLRSVKVSRQVGSTRHQTHSVAQGCAALFFATSGLCARGVNGRRKQQVQAFPQRVPLNGPGWPHALIPRRDNGSPRWVRKALSRHHVRHHRTEEKYPGCKSTPFSPTISLCADVMVYFPWSVQRTRAAIPKGRHHGCRELDSPVRMCSEAENVAVIGAAQGKENSEWQNSE